MPKKKRKLFTEYQYIIELSGTLGIWGTFQRIRRTLAEWGHGAPATKKKEMGLSRGVLPLICTLQFASDLQCPKYSPGRASFFLSFEQALCSDFSLLQGFFALFRTPCSCFWYFPDREWVKIDKSVYINPFPCFNTNVCTDSLIAPLIELKVKLSLEDSVTPLLWSRKCKKSSRIPPHPMLFSIDSAVSRSFCADIKFKNYRYIQKETQKGKVRQISNRWDKRSEK